TVMNVWLLALTVLSLASVIGPDQPLFESRLTSAPVPLTPEPFRVSGSATLLIPPETASVAPLCTVVAPAADPSALAFVICSVPGLTVVGPVYVLLPARVRVPGPSLVRAPPLPLGPSAITPLKTEDVPLTPTNRWPLPSRTFPSPASE